MSESEPIEDLDVPEWDPSKISFTNHMIAGSIAGLAEHIAVYPMDTIKTHMQCERCRPYITPTNALSSNVSGTWYVITKMIRNEGISRLWRGVDAMFVGCMPGKAPLDLIAYLC